MGYLAAYLSIDDASLDALWQLDDGPFRERILEIEEDTSFKRIDIDKIWDALHCTLTGVSASNPIDGNKLSEAIVGVHPYIYDDEDYSIYISVIDNDELPGIIFELEKIDYTYLSKQFDSSILQEQKVYPNGIWNDDKNVLLKEMESALASILKFYRKSLKEGKHVIATML